MKVTTRRWLILAGLAAVAVSGLLGGFEGGSKVPESSPLDSCRLAAIHVFAAKLSEDKEQSESDFAVPPPADVEGTEYVYRRTKFSYLFHRNDAGFSIYEGNGILDQAGRDDRFRSKLLVYRPDGSISFLPRKSWQSEVDANSSHLKAGSVTFDLPRVTDQQQ